MSIRVVIVDDDELVRSGLRAIFDSEAGLDVVGEAADGEQAIIATLELDPDVVVMDVRMDRLDGIEATRRLVRRDSERPRVLIVTTFENDDYVYDALRAGATGFVLKRAPAAELVQAVRVVADGASLLFPRKIRALVAHAGRRTDAELATRVAALTAREREVLRHVADGRTNAQIAETLVVSTETVKTHVSSVLGKLGARDRTQAVIAAYESGFLCTE